MLYSDKEPVAFQKVNVIVSHANTLPNLTLKNATQNIVKNSISFALTKFST
jgi:hypothetical protein